jgi:hypothetical protein
VRQENGVRMSDMNEDVAVQKLGTDSVASGTL